MEVNVLSDEYYSNDEEYDEDTEESDEDDIDFHPLLCHQENSDTSLNQFNFSSSSSPSEDEGGSHSDNDSGEVEKDSPFILTNRDAGAEELKGHGVRGKTCDCENSNLNSCKAAVIGRCNDGSNSSVTHLNASEGLSQRVGKEIPLEGNQQKQTIPYEENRVVVCQQQDPLGKSRTEHPPSAYSLPSGNGLTVTPEIGVDSIRRPECNTGEGKWSQGYENGGSVVNDEAQIDDNGLDSPIWKRTRAHLSLEGLSLDELEAFLEHSDEDDFFQQIDEEAEYRKFVAAVMAPQIQDSSPSVMKDAGLNIQHDETNEGIVYIGDEEDEDDENFSAEDETLVTNSQSKMQDDLQKQSADTQRNKQKNEQNTRQSKRQRMVTEAEEFRSPPRPLLPPLLPYSTVPPCELNTDFAVQYMPPTKSLPIFSAAPVAPQYIGFSRCQIHQLFALIYEHVQLLIQIHALSALEPTLSSVAEMTQNLLTDLSKTWKSTALMNTRVLSSACFSFPDPASKSSPPAPESFTATLMGPFNDSRQMSVSPYVDSWKPEMDFCAVRGAIDVPPLTLVEDYLTDMSVAMRKEKEKLLGEYTGSLFAPVLERVPLFDSCSSPSEAISDTLQKQSGNKDGSGRKGYVRKHRNEKKRLTDVGNFSMAGKDAPLALVAPAAAQAIARFRPLFNPALFPLKTSPEGIKRVLFTETEDRLLAMGVHLFNNDWEAIRHRFLPSKTSQQVAIRYKNCCSGRHPANPIKAVRNLKMTPLSVQEQMVINEALKVRRMDWAQVWRYCVPYRDPVQLPRQWREASGLPLQSRNAANAQKRRLQKKGQASKQKEQNQANKSSGSLGGHSGFGQSVPADSAEDRATADGDHHTNYPETEHIQAEFLSSSTLPSQIPISQPIVAPSTSQSLSARAGQNLGSVVNQRPSGATIEVLSTRNQEAEHLTPDTTLRRDQETFSPVPLIDSPIAFSEKRPAQEQSTANVGANTPCTTGSQPGTILRRKRYRRGRLQLNPSLPPIILPNGRVIRLSKKSPHDPTQYAASLGINRESAMVNIGTRHSTEQAIATPGTALDCSPLSEAPQKVSLTQKNAGKNPPTGVGVSCGSIEKVHQADLQQNQVRGTGNGSSKAWDSQSQSQHNGNDNISQQDVNAGGKGSGSSSHSKSASDTDSPNEQEDTRRWPWRDKGDEVMFDRPHPLLFGLPQTRQEDHRKWQLAPGMTRPVAEKAVTPSAKRMLLELVGYDAATVSQLQNDSLLYNNANKKNANKKNANADEVTANNSEGDGEQRMGAGCDVNQAGLRVEDKDVETVLARPGQSQNHVPAGEAAGSAEKDRGQDGSRRRGLDIDLNEVCEPGSEDENFDIVMQHYENRRMKSSTFSTEKERCGKTFSDETGNNLEHSHRENNVYASGVEAPAELQTHREIFRDQSHAQTVPLMAGERARANEESSRGRYSGLEALCMGCDVIEFECEEMSDSEEEETSYR